MKNEIVKRLHIIGDVHGCIEELRELIQKLDLQPYDEIIMLGDLCDKGNDSPGVIKYVRELSEAYRVTAIIGNHEFKHLRYLHQLSQGKAPKMKNADEIKKIQDNLSKEDQDFLRQMPLWKGVKMHNTTYLCVHAGVPSHHSKLYQMVGQELIDRKSSLQDLMFTRYERDGKMVVLGEEVPSDKFWVEIYDGRFGFVLFGHQPFIQEEPPIYKHAIALDTGCVYGGWLTAFTACQYADGAIIEYFTQAKAKQVYSDYGRDYKKNLE